MAVGEIVAVSGLSITILSHAGFTIWWASKVTTMLSVIGEELKRFNAELEKRDLVTQKMWSRMDELRDMIPNK